MGGPVKAGLSRNDSVKVERLDLKTLNVRANARKRVGVNALHLSVASFSWGKRSSTELIRLSEAGYNHAEASLGRRI